MRESLFLSEPQSLFGQRPQHRIEFIYYLYRDANILCHSVKIDRSEKRIHAIADNENNSRKSRGKRSCILYFSASSLFHTKSVYEDQNDLFQYRITS